MDLNDQIIAKVQFKDEIRKIPIHNEDLTYDELLLMMERVFKNKLSSHDDILMKYKDEDGDMITLSDDNDLAFALARSHVLKLVITVEEDKEEKNLEADLKSTDVLFVRKELQSIRNQINNLLDKLVTVDGDGVLLADAMNNINLNDGRVIGGKEFDPLSIQNNKLVNKTDSIASLNSRDAENVQKNILLRDESIDDTSKNQNVSQFAPQQNNMISNQQSMYHGVPQNMPPQENNISSNQPVPHQNMYPNQGMMGTQNSNLPPQNSNLPPQNSNMPPQQFPPSNFPQHGMPQNMNNRVNMMSSPMMNSQSPVPYQPDQNKPPTQFNMPPTSLGQRMPTYNSQQNANKPIAPPPTNFNPPNMSNTQPNVTLPPSNIRPPQMAGPPNQFYNNQQPLYNPTSIQNNPYQPQMQYKQ